MTQRPSLAIWSIIWPRNRSRPRNAGASFNASARHRGKLCVSRCCAPARLAAEAGATMVAASTTNAAAMITFRMSAPRPFKMRNTMISAEIDVLARANRRYAAVSTFAITEAEPFVRLATATTPIRDIKTSVIKTVVFFTVEEAANRPFLPLPTAASRRIA